MLPNRNVLRLFHPIVFSLSRKTPLKVCNFHQSESNIPYPPHLQVCCRKFHGKYTSAELRELKKALWKKELKTPLQVKEATHNQKEILRAFFSNKTSATDEEWDDLLLNICKLPGTLNESNIHGKVMEHCAHLEKLELAKSFLTYLKKNGKKFNQAVVIDFLSTCYGCRAVLDEVDIKTVRSFTNYLLTGFEVMDGKLISSVVKGLSILGDWKSCFEFIRNPDRSHLINGFSVSPLIISLLENHQFDEARKIVFEYLDKKKTLTNAVFTKWVEVFQNDPQRLEELLNIFKDYNVVPRRALCQSLIRAYSHLPTEYKLTGELTTVKHNGKCSSCKKKLEENLLHKNEFNELRDAFLNRALVGGDVFRNTTPKELDSFYKVVEKHAPFDIVIDGLNVVNSLGPQKPLHIKASLLQQMVNIFFNSDKKILVIGRKNMTKFPRRIKEDVAEKSTMFLIDNETRDDLFIIYSTLYSGPKCYFVSRDYMRSEKFRLNDDRLSDLFKRWQLSHQIVPSQGFDGLVEAPLQFKICAQRNSSQNWHIPYHDDDYTGAQLYDKDNLTKWLCLRK
ncbi:mitochondrial ribonuclease P catalytic subunit-like [Planococcus citri]|uniref:mitochondrial ribonuclease P catalytic subunit-like n=1 Tax=Planococcus citri TaxID=170843 RepID=UPI0031F7AC55